MTSRSLGPSQIIDAEFVDVTDVPQAEGEAGMANAPTPKSAADTAVGLLWQVIYMGFAVVVLIGLFMWVTGKQIDLGSSPNDQGGYSADAAGNPFGGRESSAGRPRAKPAWGPKTQTQIACRGQPRGYPFDCGSASPTGFCICP